jgi:hypothetical protein
MVNHSLKYVILTSNGGEAAKGVEPVDGKAELPQIERQSRFDCRFWITE